MTRTAPTVRAVLVSFVLRLRSEELERGCVVGRIEHVASGRQQAFADLDEVARFCLDTIGGPSGIPEPRGLDAREGVEPT